MLHLVRDIGPEKHLLSGGDRENAASGAAKAATADSAQARETVEPILPLFVAMFRPRPCQQRPRVSWVEGCRLGGNLAACPFPLAVALAEDPLAWFSPLLA